MTTNPKHLRPRLIEIDQVINDYSKLTTAAGKRVRCVQVGANDGRTNDPIYKYVTRDCWHAVLLEPQPDVFREQLQKTYQGYPHVKLENLALADSGRDLPFYRLSFTNQRWATGLASFDRQSIERHLESGYIDQQAANHGISVPATKDEYICEVSVKTTDFATLFTRHGISDLDVLCIDTEGYDYEVLKLFDFQNTLPELILYESKNLSDADYQASKLLLEQHGYSLYWQEGNTLAIRFRYGFIRRAAARLRALLRKL